MVQTMHAHMNKWIIKKEAENVPDHRSLRRHDKYTWCGIMDPGTEKNPKEIWTNYRAWLIVVY
jgi:hypothetical protein